MNEDMERAERVCDLLDSAYGRPEWVRHNEPLDELVLTILSQNTSTVNCRRAFHGLKAAFPTWEDALSAATDRLAQSIEVGGLSRIKAARISRILREIWERRGRLDLDWLAEMRAGEALAALRGFEGVGPKTAACVLLFSLGQPVLPVDTHVHRVSRRVGLIPGSASAEAAHDLLQQQVPPDRVYSFHLNAIRLGREVCRPRGPQCEICILNEECDFGRARPGTA